MKNFEAYASMHHVRTKYTFASSLFSLRPVLCNQMVIHSDVRNVQC